MKIYVAGINHRTAPLAVREQAAVSPRKLGGALLAVKPLVPRGIILSTCNRTEIYTVGAESADGRAGATFFAGRIDLLEDELSRCLYELHDRAAVYRAVHTEAVHLGHRTPSHAYGLNQWLETQVRAYPLIECG